MNAGTVDMVFARKCIIILFVILIQGCSVLIAQEKDINPVADVFSVMNIASDNNIDKLWPGFRVNEIPVLVYDSLNTYLFNSKEVPAGFEMTEADNKVYFYKGQYPLVRGNSIVRIDDNWVATSVLSSSSRRTGEKYELKDMAGIIVHEQFHIFQRTNHPGWLQNDGLLLIYPEETVEALVLRRMEKEAFKKGAIADSKDQIAGWAKLGMQKRKERLELVPYEYANYENELQLSEGLSDYIEKRARGQHPHASLDITDDIAPAGIRDLGYVEGRWMAMILDRLSPGWKINLEENDSLYLEDIMLKVIGYIKPGKKSFTKKEIAAIKELAQNDFRGWQERKKSEINAFYELPGYSIEIRSSDEPFTIRIFEPLEIEILDDGGVYHRLIFMAANDIGSIRVRNHPCITWFNNAYCITRLMIKGLEQEPAINEDDKTLSIKENGVSIELKYSATSREKKHYIIEM